MEMTFPHHVFRQDSVRGRINHETILSVVAARQANSQTVRALRQAERAPQAEQSDDLERIHYFAQRSDGKIAVRGAFWKDPGQNTTCEQVIYQAALVNIKQHPLDTEALGNSSTVRGMEHRGSYD
jgi:hypothetical protein